jgi:hypothetical protein
MSDFIPGEFEVEFPPYLEGTIQALVREVGEKPSRIIDINDPWYIDVEWTLTGRMQRFICGTWGVDVYMESIGRGPEFELPDEDFEKIPLNPSGDGKYHVRLNVPAGFIRTHVENWWEEHMEHGHGPGERETDIVYKMVVTVTYRDSGGRPGPIAGFVEYPMLQFYYAE